MTAINNFAKSFDGVNDVFVRQMSANVEIDVNFDGTAADLVQEIERAGYKVRSFSSNLIVI